MNLKVLYRNLGLAVVLIAVGMYLGHSLGDAASNTPLWIGGILFIGGVLLVGMSISTGGDQNKQKTDEAE